ADSASSASSVFDASAQELVLICSLSLPNSSGNVCANETEARARAARTSAVFFTTTSSVLFRCCGGLFRDGFRGLERVDGLRVALEDVDSVVLPRDELEVDLVIRNGLRQELLAVVPDLHRVVRRVDGVSIGTAVLGAPRRQLAGRDGHSLRLRGALVRLLIVGLVLR